MSQPPIGIDLGTSTSIITAYIDGKPVSIPDPITKSPIVPSVVGVSDTGEILVGQLALDQAVGHVVREAKRGIGSDNTYPLGGRVYTAEEIAAQILSYLKRNAEGFLSDPIEKVVISVPANYEDGRRRAVQRAAAMAGLTVIRLINEPTAAAMAYGSTRLDADETILVYDFGGGTLDVTVGEMIGGVLEIKTSHGVAELGGKDFDKRIIDAAHGDFMRKAPGAETTLRSERGLKMAAELAKKALSSTQSALVQVAAYASADGGAPDLRMPLTRDQLEAMTRDLVEDSLEAVDEALKKAGVTKRDIDRVLLVGGTTYMPSVRTAVLSHLDGKQKAQGCDPDLAVSIGACLSAASASGAVAPSTSMVVQDVSTYGIGTPMWNEIGGRQVRAYEELMPPNTPVPYARSLTGYRLMRTDQAEYEMVLLEDVHGDAQLADDAVQIGETKPLTGIPPSTRGEPHAVTLHFGIDVSGVLSLRAELPELGISATLTARMAQSTGPMRAPEELGRIDTIWEQSPIAGEFRTWIARAEERLAQTPENAAELSSALIDLKAKVSMSDRDGAKAARNRVLQCLAQA